MDSKVTTVNLAPYNDGSPLAAEMQKLLSQQKWQELINLAETNFEIAKHNADFNQIIGYAFAQLGQHAHAIHHLNNALQISPNHTGALFLMGNSQKELGDLHGAIAYYNKLIKITPNHYKARAEMALCLRDTNRTELALRFYQSIEQECPDYPYIHNLMAIVYDALGEKDTATEYYHKALEHYPEDCTIYYNMAHRLRYDLGSDFAKQLTNVYEKQKDLGQETEKFMHISYAMAYMYEKNKKHKEAFAYYQQANHAQSVVYPSLIESEAKFAEDLQQFFPATFFEKRPNVGCDSDLPFFIIGMPRSGTSLTEQILASHPQVHGAGELEIIRKIVISEIPKITNRSYPEGMEDIPDNVYMNLGNAFVKALQTFSDAPHIVDKMPHNFYLLPVIRLIVPNAKIIHCVRDPMDTCWSIFRQGFTGRHTYKYEPETMAQAYRMYLDVMNHWKSIFPDWIYDICYEDLIDNPEENIRDLLDFCGLEWHEDCLNFHQVKRNVMTASAHQVRQPLYKSGMKSWEPVAEELQPFVDALKQHDAIPERYKGQY